jgi:hypothetical protein
LIPLLLIFVIGTIHIVPAHATRLQALSSSESQTQSAQVRRYTSYGRFFPETNQASSDQFWQYWNENGGLSQHGYPISEERFEVSPTNGKRYLVQYYERAVFELHIGVPSSVLTSLLGDFEYKRRYPRGAIFQTPNESFGSVYFSQTGKRLGGGFLDYWRKNGGVPQLGYPITNEFTETSRIDGRQYTVQYFQRALLEYHPEQRDPNYRILRAQLGTLRYQQVHQSNLPNLFGDVDGDRITDRSDRCPRSPENANKIFDNDGCPDTLSTLLVFAAEDLDKWWKSNFERYVFLYRVPYRSPSAFEITGEDTVAYYTNGGRGIYYNYSTLSTMIRDYGDFVPVMIIAHEWGHLVQDIMDIEFEYHRINLELQADCYAGAWASHTEELGYLEEDDLYEAVEALLAGGDRANDVWFDDEAHGQPEERYAAFTVGYRQGVTGCQRHTPP